MSFHHNSNTGDIWVQWFKCCVTAQAPQKRRRIDRSMIGEPTNFVHLGHVGANDMQQGSRYVNQLQNQMCSKGQYTAAAPVPVNS